jgi:predicted patatin/cPLA2 family phospholipase
VAAVTARSPGGILDRLLEEEALHFEGIAGTSTGAAAQHNRANVGVYASVSQGGTARRGDSVKPE